MSFAAHQPFESVAQDRILGLGLLAVVAATLYFMFFATAKQDPEKWLLVKAQLTQSYNLAKDAPVKLSGVAIGRVLSVGLNEQGGVNVELSLSREYAAFFTDAATLKIDTQLGLDSVITGAGLTFVPAPGGQPLASGDPLKVEEPKSFDQLLSDWNVEELSAQLVSILSNLEQIVASVNANQARFDQSMANVQDMTTSMVEIASALPATLENVNTTLTSVNANIAALEPRIAQGAEGLDRTLEQTQTLLQQLNVLVSEASKTAVIAPEALNAATQTMLEVQGLTSQLRNHWLLGAGAGADTPVAPPQIRFPYDQALYEEAQGSEEQK